MLDQLTKLLKERLEDKGFVNPSYMPLSRYFMRKILNAIEDFAGFSVGQSCMVELDCYL